MKIEECSKQTCAARTEPKSNDDRVFKSPVLDNFYPKTESEEEGREREQRRPVYQCNSLHSSLFKQTLIAPELVYSETDNVLNIL